MEDLFCGQQLQQDPDAPSDQPNFSDCHRVLLSGSTRHMNAADHLGDVFFPCCWLIALWCSGSQVLEVYFDWTCSDSRGLSPGIHAPIQYDTALWPLVHTGAVYWSLAGTLPSHSVLFEIEIKIGWKVIIQCEPADLTSNRMITAPSVMWVESYFTALPWTLQLGASNM